MFHFKKFSIDDSKAAMKIGTDSVLLGAWTRCENETRILDIGTGTGILALMMAQTNPIIPIDAVEIENAAAEMAVENVKLSPWSNQIEVYNTSIQDFTNHNQYKYSLIISNPPFFTQSLKSPAENRNLARHNDTLPVSDILRVVSVLLSENGKASFILPADDLDYWKSEAVKFNLFLHRVTYVRSTVHHKPHRVMTIFSRPCLSEIIENEFIIYNQERKYTSEYQHLTRDFYLKF